MPPKKKKNKGGGEEEEAGVRPQTTGEPTEKEVMLKAEYVLFTRVPCLPSQSHSFTA